MSRLRADTLTDRTGTSAPDLTHGATSTTGTFSGDLGGGDVTLSGNATVDGTLTYQDADNINSTGIITARQGIQVLANGFDVTGISTFNSPITVAGITTINDSGLHATGVVTATSFAGDGSALTGTNRTVSLVASGTLSNGQTVIVTSDGKVAGVSTSDISQSVGSPAVFESANSQWTSATFDSANSKVVIAYKDTGNSNYGTAVVGTVSGTSITFGTPVVFESANSTYISATFDSTNSKVVIAYSDGGNSNYGKAVVGTVSGTSISFGSVATFRSAQVEFVSTTFDSTNGKVVIAYKDDGNSDYGTAIVGTVSGTSISFGSATVFESAATRHIAPVYDSTNGKVVIAYRDDGNSAYGTAIVGTVSGTSISFGSAVVFESANLGGGISAAFDSTNGKVVIAYQDDGNSSYGTAIVGTVSGTSISFGSAVVFESATMSDYNAVAYDSNAGKVVIAYRDGGNSTYGTAIVGTVSGTSISFGTAVVFESAVTDYLSATFDSTNNEVVIVYKDQGNSHYGTAVVFQNASTSTNLTSENFIGFSDAAYTNGQTATIQIISSVDDAQSGLTTGSIHYVQNNGTLSTTAGNPSVVGGTALSSTQISVKL